MPDKKVYFYTNLDAIKNQQVNDGRAFGLIDTNDIVFDASNEQFNLTNIHSVDPLKTPNAYAVCAGKILVQEVNGNPNKLNVYLKPNPEADFGDINPKIKCFVYRNIKASSLVSSNLVASNTNTLTFNIHDDHFKKTGNHNPDKKVLGLGFTSANSYPDAYCLEKAFNAPTQGYSLFPVSGGDCIGEFDSTVDFEIITDTCMFHLKKTF